MLNIPDTDNKELSLSDLIKLMNDSAVDKKAPRIGSKATDDPGIISKCCEQGQSSSQKLVDYSATKINPDRTNKEWFTIANGVIYVTPKKGTREFATHGFACGTNVEVAILVIDTLVASIKAENTTGPISESILNAARYSGTNSLKPTLTTRAMLVPSLPKLLQAIEQINKDKATPEPVVEQTADPEAAKQPEVKAAPAVAPVAAKPAEVKAPPPAAQAPAKPKV